MVAVGRDGDGLPFPARPVPVRKNMQHRRVAPPGLEIVETILGKTTGVQNTELRSDCRPVERRGFATIVEAGPIKNTGKKRSRGIMFPAALGIAPGGSFDLGRQVGVGPIVKIYSAGALRGGFLRAEKNLLGVIGVLLVGIALLDVIDPRRLDRGGNAAPATTDGCGNPAGGIEPLRESLH